MPNFTKEKGALPSASHVIYLRRQSNPTQFKRARQRLILPQDPRLNPLHPCNYYSMFGGA